MFARRMVRPVFILSYYTGWPRVYLLRRTALLPLHGLLVQLAELRQHLGQRLSTIPPAATEFDMLTCSPTPREDRLVTPSLPLANYAHSETTPQQKAVTHGATRRPPFHLLERFLGRPLRSRANRAKFISKFVYALHVHLPCRPQFTPVCCSRTQALTTCPPQVTYQRPLGLLVTEQSATSARIQPRCAQSYTRMST
ncbi:hypothetical protein BDW22DRAFT_330284 [Trametopsis cervina]|nr:hypothetical protein BDW22DRAFT_330284 [Trametopsis cervina]